MLVLRLPGRVRLTHLAQRFSRKRHTIVYTGLWSYHDSYRPSAAPTVENANLSELWRLDMDVAEAAVSATKADPTTMKRIRDNQNTMPEHTTGPHGDDDMISFEFPRMWSRAP